METIHPQLAHASNYLAKKVDRKTSSSQRRALETLAPTYQKYLYENLNLVGYSDEIVRQRVALLNQYYDFISEKGLDNVFSAQGKFRPTILEEFLFLLLKDYVADLSEKFDEAKVMGSGAIKAYSNIFFKSRDFPSFLKNPSIGINVKDQDYAIFRTFDLTVNNQSHKIAIPCVAAEAKTHIDKTMLDSIIATAAKMKEGNPYTWFIAVAEYYDVNLDVDPAYSRIDQIYILRKQKRRDIKSGRNPIDEKVVRILFSDIKKHLARPWSDIGSRLASDGLVL
ncbi:MAG: Bpu10I family restriction endonuclease [Bacteroidales bacterium]|nr:Bpu10I family restriction endonuclease [Bacteroidales bacterium]